MITEKLKELAEQYNAVAAEREKVSNSYLDKYSELENKAKSLIEIGKYYKTFYEHSFYDENNFIIFKCYLHNEQRKFDIISIENFESEEGKYSTAKIHYKINRDHIAILPRVYSETTKEEFEQVLQLIKIKNEIYNNNTV